MRAVPPQLEHSENMLAELSEVSDTQCVNMLMQIVMPTQNASEYWVAWYWARCKIEYTSGRPIVIEVDTIAALAMS